MSPLIPKATTGRGGLVELVVIVALAIGLALLIQAFVVKPYQIPSGSMEPTLDVGHRVLVERVSYRFSDPEIGDIVVFHPPQGADSQRCGVPHAGEGTPRACPAPTPQESETNFIKRLIAGPGDRLYIKNGHTGGQWGDGKGAVHKSLYRPWVPLQRAQADHDPAKRVLHDG